MAAHKWLDVARELVPEPEKLYTWWSYRARDWRASNRGRRLDHIWVSPALKKQRSPAAGKLMSSTIMCAAGNAHRTTRRCL